MSIYFWNGLEHFIFALIFAIAFSKLTRQNMLKNAIFLIGLISGASALFFLPLHIKPYGSIIDRFYQFLHYPIPDWDILILGIKWHRFFISHSLLFPVFLSVIFLHKSEYKTIALGISIGISSHLIWDAITCSMITPVVFINNFLEIRGYMAKGWLVLNGVLLFIFSTYISDIRVKNEL